MYVDPTHNWIQRIHVNLLQQQLQMSSSPLDLSTVSLFCAPHGILWLTPFFGHIFVTLLVWSAVVGSTKCRNLLVGIVIRWTNRVCRPQNCLDSNVFPMCLNVWFAFFCVTTLRWQMKMKLWVHQSGPSFPKTHATDFLCWHFVVKFRILDAWTKNDGMLAHWNCDAWVTAWCLDWKRHDPNTQ